MAELRTLWWRALYACTTSHVAAAVLLALLRLYAVVRGPVAAEGVLGFIERRYAFSGWPHYGHAWTNLHVSRMTTRLRRGLRREAPVPHRQSRRAELTRVACVGRFVGLLGFPKSLLERCPVELVVADITFRGQDAGYLRSVAADYQVFDVDQSGGIDRLAAFVNAARVDLVVNIGQKYEAIEILNRLDAPCVANLCSGSDLLHHPRVDMQLHGQPEADYFVRDDRMFCGTTASDFAPGFVHTVIGYIDPRGLLNRPLKSWRARQPLMVGHGSLYKYAAQPFLSQMCRWLQEDSTLELVLMGRDDRQSLATITDAASRSGVTGRVHYAGAFSAVRDASGEVSSEGWHTLVDFLSRARLAPNPFPMGGGSSRFEAYALGVPAPHLGVRFDRSAWGRPQPGFCEIPSMLVDAGTAWNVDDYAALGRRCLQDEGFADGLAAAQLGRVGALADADRWWRDVLNGHDKWRTLHHGVTNAFG